MTKLSLFITNNAFYINTLSLMLVLNSLQVFTVKVSLVILLALHISYYFNKHPRVIYFIGLIALIILIISKLFDVITLMNYLPTFAALLFICPSLINLFRYEDTKNNQ